MNKRKSIPFPFFRVCETSSWVSACSRPSRAFRRKRPLVRRQKTCSSLAGYIMSTMYCVRERGSSSRLLSETVDTKVKAQRVCLFCTVPLDVDCRLWAGSPFCSYITPLRPRNLSEVTHSQTWRRIVYRHEQRHRTRQSLEENCGRLSKGVMPRLRLLLRIFRPFSLHRWRAAMILQGWP